MGLFTVVMAFKDIPAGAIYRTRCGCLFMRLSATPLELYGWCSPVGWQTQLLRPCAACDPLLTHNYYLREILTPAGSPVAEGSRWAQVDPISMELCDL